MSKLRTVGRQLSMLALAAPLMAIADESYSPYANRDYPTEVYWGDTHLHSRLSFDAYSFGNRRLEPDAIYRFARGETVTAHNGMKVRLRNPLDFLVIADHSENMGIRLALDTSDPMLLRTESGKYWHDKMPEIRKIEEDNPNWHIITDKYELNYRSTPIGDEKFFQSVWDRVVDDAERNNLPNQFTAMIGYEWTSSVFEPAYSGIHRIVIFKDGADKVKQVIPFSANQSNKPEDLWAYLGRYEENTGGEVMAIPHNANLSKGRTFALLDSEGRPLSRAYAETRSRWEHLMEVTQVKGDSETHPVLSPTDEFADFETWNGTGSDEEHKYEYARSALKLGLSLEAVIGVNPFKFGMIGSSDVHTSMPTVAEDNFWGKFPNVEPDPERSLRDGSTGELGWNMNASGFAAVWAKQNTRASLFEAMKRKETYATTGTRMTVRFFGGWDYDADDALKPDLAMIGYDKGVPMGGDLTNAARGKAPRFLIRAIKDPDGANLDRIQVVKGWRDKKGKLHEKVYNVALSDGRTDRRGKTKAVGSTVDVEQAAYTNTIGDPELAAVWTDPDFDKDELAFYYLRVLEIPTPRWPAYDARSFQLDIPEASPTVTQERAYTSPIWYTPAGR